MILLIGGTTEGRVAAGVLDGAGKPYLYSTKGDGQQIELLHGEHISGGLDVEKMSAICADRGIGLIVDAAHPFAVRLHHTVAEAARHAGVPVIRYERRYPPRSGDVVWCDSFDTMTDCLNRDGRKRILALTGANTAASLIRCCQAPDITVWLRTLNRQESLDTVVAHGFNPANVLAYEPGIDSLCNLMRRLEPDAVLTKESGQEGGFDDKLEICRRFGVKLYALCRPDLQYADVTVDGPHGLRLAVQRLLPGFFKLRTGLTTGTCAAAAAKAAAIYYETGGEAETVKVTLPDGEHIPVDVHGIRTDGATVCGEVVKVAGDDPDVTDGVTVAVTLEPTDYIGRNRYIRGEGVGIVTLPGLGISPGEPAVNPVPRQMIDMAVGEVCGNRNFDITVSVQGGVELATRTFNPRVGVLGGISILGTSGIVTPFSTEAFVESIRREMQVARAMGLEEIVLNSGARSERMARGLRPDLSEHSFVHYGNAVGSAVSIASELGFSRITVGMMPGKGVKVAEGHTDTHSHNVLFDRRWLASVASAIGCSAATVELIKGFKLAAELAELPDAADRRTLIAELERRCVATLQPFAPSSSVCAVILI